MEEIKEFKVNGVWRTEKEAKFIARQDPNLSVGIAMHSIDWKGNSVGHGWMYWEDAHVIWDL